jgi:hypothetical protein
MSPADVRAFDHLRDVAGAWALLAAMLLLGALVIVARIRRPDPN